MRVGGIRGGIGRYARVLQPPGTKPINPFPRRRPGTTSGHPEPPEAAGGAGPGRRPRPASRREGGAERPPAAARTRAPGRGFTQNAAGQPAPLPPPLLPTTPGPAPLGPDRPGADLKVPLSSRSSGGAAPRCLL